MVGYVSRRASAETRLQKGPGRSREFEHVFAKTRRTPLKRLDLRKEKVLISLPYSLDSLPSALKKLPSDLETLASARRSLPVTSSRSQAPAGGSDAVARRAPARGRCPRPGFECADEGAGLGETELGGDLCDASVLEQQALCGVESHFVGEAREGDAEPFEPMSERARVDSERAADAVARQRAGPDPRPHDRFDGRDEISFRVGDRVLEQRGQDLRVVRIAIAHRPVKRAESKITPAVNAPNSTGTRKNRANGDLSRGGSRVSRTRFGRQAGPHS